MDRRRTDCEWIFHSKLHEVALSQVRVRSVSPGRAMQELNFGAIDLANAVCRGGRNQAGLASTLGNLVAHKGFNESAYVSWDSEGRLGIFCESSRAAASVQILLA